MVEIGTAIFVTLLILIHVVAFGTAFARATRWIFPEGYTAVAVLLGMGLALWGGEVFLLGEAHLLNRQVLCASAVIMLGTSAWSHPWLLARAIPCRIGARGQSPMQVSTMWLAVAAIFGIMIIACAHPPAFGDETQYHWPAAQLWASSGGWVKSPYRLTNGPALAEMLFTVPAMFNSSTAAHAIGVIFLLLITASCASLASAVGVDPLPAALAMLSIPTLLIAAPLSLNDNIAAGFALAAYAALLNGSIDKITRASIIAAAIALMAAVSAKPFAVFAVPGVCGYILYTSCRADRTQAALFTSLPRSFAVAGVVALTLLLWVGHCYRQTGRLWDTNGYAIARNAADPLWNSPNAAGRHARPQDYLLIPVILPTEMTIGRENGPYGNRIGPLLLVFFPLGIAGLRVLERERRHTLYVLLGAAAFYLIAFAPTAPKTRFHLFVWAIAAIVAALGFSWTQRQRASIASVCFAGFMLLVALGTLDACRHIYSFGQFLLPAKHL
jgi:hypothetical protein